MTGKGSKQRPTNAEAYGSQFDVIFRKKTMSEWQKIETAPAAYVNGDELDNMLDDRTATISGVRSGHFKTALFREQQALYQYSIDVDEQGIRARTVHAVLGALASGANNENKPPSGHWLAEIWDIARAEREGAVDRVTTLFESDELPYLPDIARAINDASTPPKEQQ